MWKHFVSKFWFNRSAYKSWLDLIKVEKDALVHAHFASSCDAASKARNIKIPHVPLSVQSRPLVQLNILTDFPIWQLQTRIVCLRRMSLIRPRKFIVLELLNMGVSDSIENPANSLFWETSWIKWLLQQNPGHKAQFYHCMHGGDRDKLTIFWRLRELQRPLFFRIQTKAVLLFVS